MMFALAPTVSAQDSLFKDAKQEACKGATLGNGGCNKAQAGTDIDNTIKFVVNILTLIVGVVAVIMVIVNGFRFITSNGDSNAVSAAKNGLLYAIVGLVIVALAQVIVRFVIDKV
jgi:hypothetical protein